MTFFPLYISCIWYLEAFTKGRTSKAIYRYLIASFNINTHTQTHTFNGAIVLLLQKFFISEIHRLYLYLMVATTKSVTMGTLGWHFILTIAKILILKICMCEGDWVPLCVYVVWITFWFNAVYLKREKWFSFKSFSPFVRYDNSIC